MASLALAAIHRGPRAASWRLAQPAAALLLPLAILAINARAEWLAQLGAATAALEQTSAAAAEYASRYLTGFVVALGHVAELTDRLPDEALRQDEPALRTRIRNTMADLPDSGSAFLVDRHGGRLVMAKPDPELATPGFSAADRSYVRALAAPDAPALHISEPIRSRYGGNLFFALSRRRDGAADGGVPGSFGGAVVIEVDPLRFGAGLQTLLREPTDNAAIGLEDGTIIVRTNDLPLLPITRLRPFPPGEQAMVIEANQDPVIGVPLLTVRRRVGTLPLFVSVRRPRAEIVAAWWRSQRIPLATGLALTAALFLLALRSARDQARLAEANAGLGSSLDAAERTLARIIQDAGIIAWVRREGSPIQRIGPVERVWGQGAPATLERENLPFWVDAETRQRFIACTDTAAAQGRAGLEYRILRPRRDGPPEPAWLATEMHCLDPTPGARHFVGITYDVTARHAAEAAAEALRQGAVEHKEAERLALARDLHDGLGAQLTLLHLELGKLARAGAAPAGIARLQALAEALGRETNRIAGALRPVAIDDIGLVPALRACAEDWARGTGTALELELAEPQQRLPLTTETTLYRVLQEALTNIARHARAQRVGVILDAGPGRVRLVVEDDGIGMPETPAGDRFGLRGMEERLALVGGSLELESAPGRGTTLLATVPA